MINAKALSSLLLLSMCSMGSKLDGEEMMPATAKRARPAPASLKDPSGMSSSGEECSRTQGVKRSANHSNMLMSKTLSPDQKVESRQIAPANLRNFRYMDK